MCCVWIIGESETLVAYKLCFDVESYSQSLVYTIFCTSGFRLQRLIRNSGYMLLLVPKLPTLVNWMLNFGIKTIKSEISKFFPQIHTQKKFELYADILVQNCKISGHFSWIISLLISEFSFYPYFEFSTKYLKKIKCFWGILRKLILDFIIFTGFLKLVQNKLLFKSSLVLSKNYLVFLYSCNQKKLCFPTSQ